MINDLKILGYWQAADNSFKPIIQPPDRIYTRAFIFCSQCKSAISGSGGPKYNSFCVPCYNQFVEDQEKK